MENKFEKFRPFYVYQMLNRFCKTTPVNRCPCAHSMLCGDVTGPPYMNPNYKAEASK